MLIHISACSYRLWTLARCTVQHCPWEVSRSCGSVQSDIHPLVHRAFSHRPSIPTTYLFVCQFIIPWLFFGWTSVRREADRLIAAFLALSLLMLAGWVSLFFSPTFRWQFSEWKFFGVMVVASSALLVLSTVLGVVCWYNFDKGLKRFCASFFFLLSSFFFNVLMTLCGK